MSYDYFNGFCTTDCEELYDEFCAKIEDGSL